MWHALIEFYLKLFISVFWTPMVALFDALAGGGNSKRNTRHHQGGRRRSGRRGAAAITSIAMVLVLALLVIALAKGEFCAAVAVGFVLYLVGRMMTL
jgi:hypothetical protein